MSLRSSWLFLCCLAVAVAFPNVAFPQSEQFCDISDSTASHTTGQGLDTISHLFGKDLTNFPNEFVLSADPTYRAFTQVFRLHVTRHVSGHFNSAEWSDIINQVMSNDTTATADHVFAKVWSYFLRDGMDGNTYYAGVRFTIGDSTYTKIHIYLYDTSDWSPSDSMDTKLRV